MIVRALEIVIRYWKLVSLPLLGNRCRFHPSCSEYMLGAVRLHGVTRGLLLGIRRIGSCHSLSKRDPIDPVPPKSKS